jgi:hypothetical protein
MIIQGAERERGLSYEAKSKIMRLAQAAMPIFRKRFPQLIIVPKI